MVLSQKYVTTDLTIWGGEMYPSLFCFQVNHSVEKGINFHNPLNES